jgi:hypothetical protein
VLLGADELQVLVGSGQEIAGTGAKNQARPGD